MQVDATLLLPVAMYYLGFPVILLFLCTTLEATSTGLWSKLDFVNGFCFRHLFTVYSFARIKSDFLFYMYRILHTDHLGRAGQFRGQNVAL